MRQLKLVWQTFTQLINQIGSIPGGIKKVVRRRRQQATLKALEAERLDRILNPMKYRGK